MALIIERFNSTAHGRTLAEAQASLMEMQIESADLEIEFRHALQRLQAGRVQGRIEDLRKKIQTGGLSEAERAEYPNLIKQFDVLKRVPDDRPA